MKKKLGEIGKKIKIHSKELEIDTYLLETVVISSDEKIKGDVFSNFYPIAQAAFNQADSDFFREDVYNHLFHVGHLMLMFDAKNGGNPIAFRTYSLFDFSSEIKDKGRTIYIEGTAVDPRYQGFGIYQQATRALIKGFDFLTSRTQNPVVVTALSKIFSKIYPFTGNPGESVKSIGNLIAQYLKMNNYDRDSMTGRGIYRGVLTGVMPKIDNAIKDSVFEKIDPERGDCIIVVCPV